METLIWYYVIMVCLVSFLIASAAIGIFLIVDLVGEFIKWRRKKKNVDVSSWNDDWRMP